MCGFKLENVTCFIRLFLYFLRIFATQKSRFVFGILQQHFSLIISPFSFSVAPYPCQKHPFTKMQVRYFLSTISGCPGNRLWFYLYRNPLAHSPRRTIISGSVYFDRIAAVLADRRACSRSAELMPASLCSCLIAAFLWRCCGESLSISFKGFNQFVYRATNLIEQLIHQFRLLPVYVMRWYCHTFTFARRKDKEKHRIKQVFPIKFRWNYQAFRWIFLQEQETLLTFASSKQW